MKERPILFSAPMVRALLDGSKTQTRRVVNKKHLEWMADSPSHFFKGNWDLRPLPYGISGDRLWVRETWCREFEGGFSYKADDAPGEAVQFVGASGEAIKGSRWKPSIRMPRAVSRITLEITGVRVERLQDISEADAIAEGAPPSHPSIDKISRELGFADFSRSWYGQLWEQINGPTSWAANPWVWVIEFKVVKK